MKTGEHSELIDKDLKIIKNMVSEMETVKGEKFSRVNDLVQDKFNDTVIEELYIYLDKIKRDAEQRQSNAAAKKDAVYMELVQQLGSRDAVRQLQADNQNKRLEEMLLNKNEIDKIIETQDFRLVQMKDPAYHITRFKNGRAHFYSPVKCLGNYTINTFTFNIIFIWITTVLLYIALNFNLLKKVLDGFSNLQLRLKFKREK